MKILQVIWIENRRFCKFGGAQNGIAQTRGVQTGDAQTKVPRLGVPRPRGSPVLDSPDLDPKIGGLTYRRSLAREAKLQPQLFLPS